MSWSPLAPPATKSSKGSGAAPLTMRAAVGVKGQRVVLTIRAAVHGTLSWLKPEAPVGVSLGSGEHAGMLRLTPQGPFRVMRAGGGGDKAGKVPTPVQLRLSSLPGMKPGEHRATLVEYEVHDDRLEVILPDWARPVSERLTDLAVERAAAASPAAHTAIARKAPFATAGTTGPDPLKHLRRGAGPVPT